MQSGVIVFLTGVSGDHNDVPELRRCGWSAAMLNANGVLGRAVHGVLAGAQQTVGRAERLAGLRALQYMCSVKLLINNLLGFVQDGELWRDGAVQKKVTCASAPCPGSWRQLVRLKREPP
eukprot:7692619-Pyramimonas_sp.AAC.1